MKEPTPPGPCPLIVVAVCALSSCTMAPRYDRPALPVSARYPGAEDFHGGVPASDMVWKSFFKDERLKRLIELALSTNRDLRVAMLNVQESQAQFRVTRSASFPTVGANGSYTRQLNPGVEETGVPTSTGGVTTTTSPSTITNLWSASVGTTSYEIDMWGRVRSLNKQALEKYFATAEAQRAAQITLVSSVATQYFALRETEAQLDLARQTLETVQESYKLNKATFDAGESNELDLRTAEGQVATARVNVITYERDVAQARNALVLLLGQPLPESLPAARPFSASDLVANVPAGLPSDLVLRRPDILEAEHTLKAANANIGAARAAFFPLIQFTGSIGTTSEAFSKLLGTSTGVWALSPEVTLPIFTGGQNTANLDAAKVSKSIEIANYEKAIQTAFREVADALVGTNSYKRQIVAQDALSEAQQKRFELATVRYRQGEDTYLNVLSAQQDLYSAQQQRIEAQFNKLSSQIQLYQALGGGWK